jgi:hypothetical protein
MALSPSISEDSLISAHCISTSNYEKIRLLGEGGVGATYLAQERSTSTHFVITFAKHAPENAAALIESLIGVTHPRLLSPTGFAPPSADRHRPLAICTPYRPNGSLAGLLRSGANLTPLNKLKILFGVAEAIRHLHSIGIVHGALTLSNVLLDGEMEPLVCDFGREALRASVGISDRRAYGNLAYAILTGMELKPHDPVPELGLQIPMQFQDLVGGCWEESENPPTFEGIVLGFFGRFIAVALSDTEVSQFRYFQGVSMPASFALRAILSAGEKIRALTTRTDELFQTLRNLNSEMTRATAPSVRTGPTNRGSMMPLPLPRPLLQIPRLSTGKSVGAVGTLEVGPVFGERPVPKPQLQETHARTDVEPPTPFPPLDLRRNAVPRKMPTVLDPSHPSNYGICNFLSEKYGGNVVSTGMVSIRGNSIDDARDQLLPQLVNYEWDKCWTSRNVENSWVQFHFMRTLVFITHYGIKTYRSGPGFSHLKSWVLQGSRDGTNWFDLNVQENCAELNGRSKIAIFPLQDPNEVCFIKLRQTGVNHGGDHYMILTNIEFYGSLPSDT